MAEKKSRKTVGKAIDGIITALEDLDEFARITAIKAVCEYLKINISADQFQENFAQAEGKTLMDTIQSQGIEKANKIVDIRTLKDEKKPISAIEMACIVSYYLENHAPSNEIKDTIIVNDIEKYFKQADYRLPRVQSQVLLNAKAAGYFDRIDAGTYKLNPVGYNLVVHTLPRSGKVKKKKISSGRKRATKIKAEKGTSKKKGNSSKTSSKKKK